MNPVSYFPDEKVNNINKEGKQINCCYSLNNQNKNEHYNIDIISINLYRNKWSILENLGKNGEVLEKTELPIIVSPEDNSFLYSKCSLPELFHVDI